MLDSDSDSESIYQTPPSSSTRYYSLPSSPSMAEANAPNAAGVVPRAGRAQAALMPPAWENRGDYAEVRTQVFAGRDWFGLTVLPTMPEYVGLPAEQKARVITTCALAESLLVPREPEKEFLILCRMIAETLLPRPRYATHEEAGQCMISWAKALLKHAGASIAGMRLRTEDILAAKVEGQPLHGINPDGEMTAEQAWDTVSWIAAHGVPDTASRSPAAAYAATYISLAKKGTITARKLNTIIGALAVECNIDLAITTNDIAILYNQLMTRIQQDEIGTIFDTWSQYMMGTSLRMMITLNQAAGSGLTSLTTIKKALTKFPSFKWGRVVSILPEEAKAVEKAFQAVGADKYYGFRRDYGAASSTLYRSFSWVAKELLLKHGGPDFESLRDYKGWASKPLHQQALKELVDAFIPEVATDADQDTGFLTTAAEGASGLI